MMTISNQSPSTGYISWSGLHIQFSGVNYSIENGNTDKTFAFWRPAISATVLVVYDELPTDITANDCLIFLNKNGVATLVPTATWIDGDLVVPGSITTKALAAECITADKLYAGLVSSGVIEVDNLGALNIQAESIGAAHIHGDTITGDRLVSEAITSREIAAASILANHIKAGEVSAGKLSAGSVATANLQSTAVTADKIDVDNLFASAAFLQKLQVGSTYVGATPPSSPAVGQLWRNTGVTPNELLAWNGKGTSSARRYVASASGAIATIEDLSDSDDRALAVTVKTVANQAGSGTPSPTNIRAISPAVAAGTAISVTRSAEEGDASASYSLTAQQALYGVTGAEDERGSDGHETHKTALVTLTGNENWSVYSGWPNNLFYSDNALPGVKSLEGYTTVASMVCSHFTTDTPDRIALTASVSGVGVSLQTMFLGFGSDTATVPFQDVAALKAWLANQHAAGTPVQVVYLLATPTALSSTATPIAGADGVNVISSDQALVKVDYTGSSWATVGAVQRLEVESVSITPEEGLRVDTTISSADGTQQVNTYFNARGNKYGLFNKSNDKMILGGLVLPDGSPVGVAGALVEPGSSGNSRIQIQTDSTGSGQARNDLAALELVQPSFEGATDASPGETGQKVPVRLIAKRNTITSGGTEPQFYRDNYNSELRGLGSIRVVAEDEDQTDLSWLLLQQVGEHSSVYANGYFDAGDPAMTLSKFAPNIHMANPTSESIVYNATTRSYMQDWKDVYNDYEMYEVVMGGVDSARKVGIKILDGGLYRFTYGVDLVQSGASSAMQLLINKMDSSWVIPTNRNYLLDTDYSINSVRKAYRRLVLSAGTATSTAGTLVGDMWCFYGDIIIPAVQVVTVSKTLITETTFFTCQKIG